MNTDTELAPLTPAEIEAAERLLMNATALPWVNQNGEIVAPAVLEERRYSESRKKYMEPHHVVCLGDDYDEGGNIDDNDRLYIIAACNLLPRALAQLQAQAAEIERHEQFAESVDLTSRRIEAIVDRVIARNKMVNSLESEAAAELRGAQKLLAYSVTVLEAQAVYEIALDFARLAADETRLAVLLADEERKP